MIDEYLEKWLIKANNDLKDIFPRHVFLVRIQGSGLKIQRYELTIQRSGF